MVGSYCSVYGCSNRKRGNDIHFFRFPKDKERSKRWVINCRREDLMTKTPEYLNRNCTICSEHFEEIYFMNKEKQDKLVWNAIPTIFPQFGKTPSHRKPPIARDTPEPAAGTSTENVASVSPTKCVKVIETEHSYSAVEESPVKISGANLDCMADAIVDLQRKLYKETQHDQNEEQKEQAKLSADEVVAAAVDLGLKPAAANFFKGQLHNCSRSLKGRRWTTQDKATALGIYFKSRSAYSVLSTLFTMPSSTTLNRFVTGIPTSPGVNADLMKLLAVKAKDLTPLARHCIVTFDEMSLRQELTYNAAKDRIEGLVDLQRRLPTPCNEALVFMARGIGANWKQPLSFYLSSNAAPASDLKVLLQENLAALLNTGLKPVAVVCDQGSCNRSLYGQLGISVDKPFFELESQKIFALHDTPHVLKNIRNTLKKNDITFAGEKV